MNTERSDMQSGPDAEYQPSLRRLPWLYLLPLLALVLLARWLPFDRLSDLHEFYHIFHIWVETVAVIIAFLMFAVGWHAVNRGASLSVLVLACGFLGVGIIDLGHMLSYPDLPNFLSVNNADKAIYFWLVARLLAALSIFAALLLPWHARVPKQQAWLLLGIVALVVLLTYFVIMFLPELLPRMFEPGVGLTRLKLGAEYFLIAFNLLLAALIWRKMHQGIPFDALPMLASVLITAMGGYWFSSYGSVTDGYIMLGHLYKLLAYLLLLKAVLSETVEWPYRRLQLSEQQLRASLTDLRIAAAAFDTQVAIMVTNAEQRILKVNKTFTDITGYTAEEAIGKTPRMLSSGMQTPGFYREMYAQLVATDRWEGEIWNRRKNGEVYPEHLVITVLKDANGSVEYYVANFGDLTLAKQAEERIHNLAYYDPLTRLPNRRLLLDHITRAQTQAQRNNGQSFWALLFIDLDNFKGLNDVMGHVTGDLLLYRAAERIKACTRESDTVSRPGGDEFAILLDGLSGDLAQAAKAAQEVAAKIIDQISKPYYLKGQSYTTTASVGVTLFNSDAVRNDELLGQSEFAMYTAKASGGNTFNFFTPAMHEAAVQRSRLEADLRAAIAQQEFELYFQPKVDAKAQIAGYEALIRWHHPLRGMISPAEFIPLAESTGLIRALGDWVLRTACQQLATWATDPEKAHWRLSVNISERQLSHDNFVQEVEAALRQNGFDQARASMLEFEITETMLMQNIEASVRVINQLSAMGIHFAMDDFGTGYSSLSYLKMLPLNCVKIDQTFVRDMLVDQGDSAIVEMVIALAKTLELEVVAEGVETLEQHRALVELGCDFMQGYYYGKPARLKELVSQDTMSRLPL